MLKLDFKTYPCLGKVLGHLGGEQVLTRRPSWDLALRQDGREHLKGVLVTHSDFWLTTLRSPAHPTISRIDKYRLKRWVGGVSISRIGWKGTLVV